jgi:hypothetical protein
MANLDPAGQDALIAQFSAIAGTSTRQVEKDHSVAYSHLLTAAPGSAILGRH